MASQENKNNAELSPDQRMPFVRRNYLYVLIGCVVVFIGFLLMIGGGSDDPNVFDESVFGFRQITLAPIVVIAGFAFVIYAILYTPRPKKEKR